MPTYQPVDDATATLVRATLQQHHPELIAVDLQVYSRFAFSAGGTPAVKVHGRAVAGKLKIESYDRRCAGALDVTLTLDGDAWAGRPEKEQRAVLRSLFLGVALKKEKDGSPATDDASRPKLEKVLPDLHAEGWEAVISEYGKDSLEAQTLDEIYARPAVQGVLFGWGAAPRRQRSAARSR